jgi:serine/threonine protein kinase
MIYLSYLAHGPCRLGRGSFAAVVKALHKPTGRFFAVKIIPKPQSLLQPQTVKMLDREMSILKKLSHVSVHRTFNVAADIFAFPAQYRESIRSRRE